MGKDYSAGQETNPEEKMVTMTLDEVVAQGAQKMLQKALEVEVDLFLERFQYIMDDNGHRQVVRNGYHNERKIVTGAGQVEVRVPRVDDRILEKHNEPRFKSSFIPPYLRRTKNIEELLPVLYLKGISTGDFQEALERILGKEVIGLSAQTIVRLKEVWQKEYDEWTRRRFDDVTYVYWWVDGIHFNVRLDTERQCILVIIGARADGTKEVVAVSDGFRESKESWLTILRDLKRRGLTLGSKLGIGDGALGFWTAQEEEFPRMQQQLCWVHKTANVLDKLPKSLQGKAKNMIYNIYLAPTKMDANVAFDIFIEEFDAKYQKAVDCIRDHRAMLMTFFNYPAEHWQHIRSTNVVESALGTVRHRTRKTKGCGSRNATLTMVFKLLQSAQNHWIRLRSHEKVRQVEQGVKFEDGIRAEEKQLVHAETTGVL